MAGATLAHLAERASKGMVEGLPLIEALENRAGVAREIVTLNAGTALYAANVAASIADGIQSAREAIASGRARAKIDELARFTQQFKHKH